MRCAAPSELSTSCRGRAVSSCSVVPVRSLRHPRRSERVSARAAPGSSSREQLCLISLDPQGPCTVSTPCWVPPAVAFGFATVATVVIMLRREPKKAVSEVSELQPSSSSRPEDPRQHQRALARARQAGHLAKAVTLLKAAEPSKAYMELTGALMENSVCRSPCLDGKHSKDEYKALYRLHIQNCEVPPNFATLLQLQEMLGLTKDEAEALELEVLTSSAAFSI